MRGDIRLGDVGPRDRIIPEQLGEQDTLITRQPKRLKVMQLSALYQEREYTVPDGWEIAATLSAGSGNTINVILVSA